MIYIIDHCKRIEEKMVNINDETFYKDKDIQEIVCFNIFQIGELVKGLSPEFASRYTLVPWNKIKKMRDVIGHGYGTIKMDRVLDTARNDIKPLKKYCEKILEENK